MPGRRTAIVLCASACAAAALPWRAGAQAVEGDDAARLRRLLDASDEALLDRNPIWALYRGDTRRAGQHGDFVSAAYVEGERRAAEADLARLAEIRRDRLSAADRIAYDAFRWSRENARERNSPPAASIWPLLRIDQMNGWHLHFAELSSGGGVAPYRTVVDYDNGLARIDGFIGWLERATGRMREGQRSGVVLPRVIVERVISQFDTYAAQGLDDSPYYGPVRTMPPEIAEPERTRLAKAYAAAVEERLKPAFRRTSAFLRDEYLRSARATVGLSAIPGGAAYYATLIRAHTTTTLVADEVHRLGLAEVARIRSGMTAAMRKASFDGSLAQFFEHVRTDRRFEPRSAEELAEGYAAIGRRVDAAVLRLFAALPKTPLAIRPTPAAQAVHDAAARYNDGSLETGQPAVFYFNTHDLPARKLWHMETLYLHEAVPGHHLQTATAAENTALPKLLRFDGNTAYNEGWALYAESLGPELGLFDDPYQLFGHYNDEMLRAMRLVVDSGLHAQGWSRERAIDYMLENSAMTRVDATAEVERYIVNPGQALAYKVGALTIRRLRTKAEQALGSRFDVRAFHGQVLDTGSIPMAVLEAKIEAWIGNGGPTQRS
jgi:uncharacterized protein (DUF885 family)